MIIKRYLLIIFISLSTFYNISAQTSVSKFAGEFLAIGVGGRALGMGGAYSALANDVTAGYYNPAGLIHLDYPQISIMHDERFGNLVNYDYIGIALPYGKDMSFALSIMRLGVDGIPDTRNALVDANGDGILDITSDRLDVSRITEFSNQDWAFYLSFAKRKSNKFSYGGSIKIIRRNLAEFSATGIGFDLGVQYQPTNDLFFGATLQDVTTTLVAWNTGRNELISPTLKVGTAYKFKLLGGTITPVLDIDIRFENRRFASNFNVGPISADFHEGFEYSYKNLFSIRAGYNDIKQFTIGAGINLPKLSIDYSFARFNDSKNERLPDTHRISLTLTLIKPKFLRDKK